MRKIYIALAGLLVVMTVFITTASAYEGTGLSVVLTDNGASADFMTQAANVGEFLEEMEIALGDMDRISYDIDVELAEGMHIEIDRAIPVHVRLDGQLLSETFYARPGSILSMFVNDLRATTGWDYSFDRSGWHRRLSPLDVIELSSVRRISAQDYAPISYNREYVETDRLYLGQEEVYTPGVPGRYLVDYEVVLVGGEENGRTEIDRQLVEHPVNAVVHVGTKLPAGHAMAASGEVFTYARSLTMEATAYTLSFECTGRHPDHPLFGVTASGMMAQVGVVAVDTNVIPFHTRLYIEGYGFAVAGDRGGAIRGDKIDLFFDTRDEVRQFGRRHIQVWILDEI